MLRRTRSSSLVLPIVVIGCFSSPFVACTPEQLDCVPDGDLEAVTGDGEVDGTTYAYHVPACAQSCGPHPVLYTLHGSGGSGSGAVQGWIPTSDASCFIVVGQDSAEPQGWDFVDDDEIGFFSMLEDIEERFDIDGSRRILYGYSAGAHWAYYMAIAYSETFAAMGVYAGSLFYAAQRGVWPEHPHDPIPVFIAHGTEDTVVSYEEATRARQELEDAGWPVELYTVDGGGHALEPTHREEAWRFWMDSLE